MQIKLRSTKSNHPDPMLHKLAQLFPLFVLVTTTGSALAVSLQPHHHYPAHRQLADAQMGRKMDNLNLTPEQKTKVEQVRASERTQIEAILTPEQRQQFQQLKSQREAKKSGSAGINLTAEQKTKLDGIRKAKMDQFRAILTPEQQAQIGKDRGGWGKGGGMGRLEKLNLTADQKTKMEQLQASARTQMDAILTPEQQQQAKAMRDRRQAMGGKWQSLNLTADQKAKMKAIHQTSKQQLNSILTPEQQTKLKSGRHFHGRRSV